MKGEIQDAFEDSKASSEIEMKNKGKNGRGFGRMGGWGLGPEGICFCPSCEYTIEHSAGVPCYQIICPSCGTRLRRKK